MRIAAQDPAAVADVLRATSDSNGNPLVWEAVAKAACEMPAAIAAGLVRKLTNGLQTPGARLFSESVVDVVIRLAGAGRHEAFALTEYLLYVESADAIDDDEGLGYRFNTEWVFPRFGWHGQRELLERLIPALEAFDAERTLKLLLSKIERVKALAEAVEASSRWLVWGLEFESRRDRENIVSEIVGATSDLAERIAGQGPEAAERVMSVLDDYEGDVFKRLRHRVLAAAGEHLRDQLDAFIMSDEPIHTDYSAREVALVVRQQFRNASPQARKAFADAVMRGPNRADLRVALSHEGRKEVTDGEIDEYVGHWQRRRLRWFRGDIPEELHGLAESHSMLGAKPTFEEQELAEVGSYASFGSWGGVEPTPITPDQLSNFSPQEAVAFLSSWRPGEGKGTAEGLHAALSQFARENPAGAIGILDVGADLEASVIESLLRGLLEKARAGDALEWDLLVAILHGVVRRAAAVEDIETSQARWWRRALSAGLEIIREASDHNSIQPDVTLWAVLEDASRVRLLWDLAERDAPESFEDVEMASLNDAAGHLAWAVIATALRHYRALLPGDADITDEMREEARAPVREALVPLLDRLVAEQGQNAPSVQAVVGQFVPQLHLLVPEWMQENEELLFGKGLDEPVPHPAWTGYVRRARLYDSVFLALRPWYAKAAKRAREWATAAGDARGRDSVAEQLAGHLLGAVLRGLVTPQDEDGLLVAAFQNVDAPDWGHAYWSVFRGWSDADEPASADFIERLVKFWEWRIAQLEADPASERTIEEAKGLGWFFHTPYIPDADVIRLGRATARLAKGQLEMYSRWDRMIELAQADPDGAFEIGEAAILAELGSDYPHVADDVRPFLEHILDTGSKQTRDGARRLIHKLGEKGFRGFRDLLDTLDAA